jgi:hypothetical protein
MAESASQLARKLLASDHDALEDVQVHQFEDDRAAHDDDLQTRVENQFNADFNRLQAQLVQEFGAPSRTGTVDDDLIPLGGVFLFAVWEVQGKQLFAAAAHEDRELPYLLVLGTAVRDRP